MILVPEIDVRRMFLHERSTACLIRRVMAMGTDISAAADARMKTRTAASAAMPVAANQENRAWSSFRFTC
jgi:hypothetical protein